MGVEAIDRIARAFGKFESLAHFDNCDWLVSDINVWHCEHAELPGTVVHKSNTEIVVAALDGMVCMRIFQPRTI